MAEVARDYAGIRRYAALYLDHAARVEAAGERAELVAEPEIPMEYAVWLKYLLKVELAVTTAQTLAGKLRADVLLGLEALKSARNEFLNEHRRCRCGKWLPALAKACACGAKF